MGIGKTLNSELGQWGVLAITLVVVMIILGKFKDVSGNTTTTNTTVDNFITGLAEPGNWVVIVVVGLVGFALIKFMQKRKG